METRDKRFACLVGLLIAPSTFTVVLLRQEESKVQKKRLCWINRNTQQLHVVSPSVYLPLMAVSSVPSAGSGGCARRGQKEGALLHSREDAVRQPVPSANCEGHTCAPYALPTALCKASCRSPGLEAESCQKALQHYRCHRNSCRASTEHY
jgi:hypothetical protein